MVVTTREHLEPPKILMDELWESNLCLLGIILQLIAIYLIFLENLQISTALSYLIINWAGRISSLREEYCFLWLKVIIVTFFIGTIFLTYQKLFRNSSYRMLFKTDIGKKTILNFDSKRSGCNLQKKILCGQYGIFIRQHKSITFAAAQKKYKAYQDGSFVISFLLLKIAFCGTVNCIIAVENWNKYGNENCIILQVNEMKSIVGDMIMQLHMTTPSLLENRLENIENIPLASQ